MSRRTAQLFDLMFKCIIKDASSSAIVHLINGIYKKDYPLSTPVEIGPTEFVKEHPKSGKLEKIVSDIIITLDCENGKDTYLMEAQIGDDAEMILRIFNYGIYSAFSNREMSEDGSRMRIKMPSPVVIYWEASEAKDVVSVEIEFPDNKSIVYEIPTFKVLQHSVSELGDMALLLPFYILKIRRELERNSEDSEKKKALSKKLLDYIIEIDHVFKKCRQNNYITDVDVAMLLRRTFNMNRELYGKHKEFVEVDMKSLEEVVEVDFVEKWHKSVAEAADKVAAEIVDKTVAEAIAETEAKAENRIIQTAKAMKAKGMNVSLIAEITGLSIMEVEKI